MHNSIFYKNMTDKTISIDSCFNIKEKINRPGDGFIIRLSHTFAALNFQQTSCKNVFNCWKKMDDREFLRRRFSYILKSPETCSLLEVDSFILQMEQFEKSMHSIFLKLYKWTACYPNVKGYVLLRIWFFMEQTYFKNFGWWIASRVRCFKSDSFYIFMIY